MDNKKNIQKNLRNEGAKKLYKEVTSYYVASHPGAFLNENEALTKLL